MGRDDGDQPDESPFLAADVGVVGGGGEVDAGEERPDEEEGCDVEVEGLGEGVVQGGAGDLRVVDQGHGCDILSSWAAGGQRDEVSSCSWNRKSFLTRTLSRCRFQGGFASVALERQVWRFAPFSPLTTGSAHMRSPGMCTHGLMVDLCKAYAVLGSQHIPHILNPQVLHP